MVGMIQLGNALICNPMASICNCCIHAPIAPMGSLNVKYAIRLLIHSLSALIF
jgi:hypothetical protein